MSSSSAVTIAIEPVTVDRPTAALMLGMSLRHFQDEVQPHLRVVRSGRLRLFPVDELKRWAQERAHRAID